MRLPVRRRDSKTLDFPPLQRRCKSFLDWWKLKVGIESEGGIYMAAHKNRAREGPILVARALVCREAHRRQFVDIKQTGKKDPLAPQTRATGGSKTFGDQLLTACGRGVLSA